MEKNPFKFKRANGVTFDLNFRTGAGIVNIKYIAGDWPTRLSFFVSERAFINRADINYKLVPSFEDIYLIPKFGTDVTFVHFYMGILTLRLCMLSSMMCNLLLMLFIN